MQTYSETISLYLGFTYSLIVLIKPLLYGALAALSNMLLGLLPGASGEVLREIPVLQVGIPAVFSIYFDLFAGFLQAFIFCMLTMMYIRAAAEE